MYFRHKDVMEGKKGQIKPSFKCHSCHKEFYRYSSYLIHKSSHRSTAFTCDHCQRVFTDHKCLLMHIKSHMQMRKFKLCHTLYSSHAAHKKDCKHCQFGLSCRCCNVVFHKASDFVKHIEDRHKRKQFIGTTAFICSICKSVFTTVAELALHRMVHFPNPDYCFLCGETIKSEDHMHHRRFHLQGNKDEKDNTCHICKKSFHSKHYLERHIANHSGDKKYECELCGEKFLWPAGLRGHKQSKHSVEKKLKCEICGKKIKRRSTLKSHLATHYERRMFKCYICHKTFNKQDYLRAHRASAHSDAKKHACKYCGKKFKTNSCCRKHERIHTGIPKQECPVCHKYVIKLGNHLKIHDANEEKQFSCTFCKKSFLTKRLCQLHEFKVHIEERTEECLKCGKLYKPSYIDKHKALCLTKTQEFKCSLCAKLFKTALNLKHHMQLHSGERKYVCEVCQKCFVRPDHLRSHLLTHSDEKNFQCDQCDKSFRQKQGLRSHVKAVHLGIKPFKCDICEKGHCSKQNLNRHQLVHTGAKPFHCAECGLSYYSVESLKHHNASQHPEKEGKLLNRTKDKPISANCSICGENFTSKSKFLYHVQNGHQQEVSCSVCSVTLKNENVLVKHLQTNHRLTKDLTKFEFECMPCDRVFKTKVMWVKHNHDNHGTEMKNSCPECEEKFWTQGELRNHLKSHHAPTFDCDDCGKPFKTKQGLTLHMSKNHV